MKDILTTRHPLVYIKLVINGTLVTVTLLTGCTSQPASVSQRQEAQQLVNQHQNASTTPNLSKLDSSATPHPTISARQSPQPTIILTNPPSTAVSLDFNSKPYTNTKEGYSILIPSDWSVYAEDTGVIYFHDENSRAEVGKGLTNWEAAIGGVQFVGRNLQLTPDMQYGSILPNHCLTIEHQQFEAAGSVGRSYVLECDNDSDLGKHRRQHIYIPQGNRFIEFWLRVDSVVLVEPDKLLSAIAHSLRFD